jgi:hypothetical protein
LGCFFIQQQLNVSRHEIVCKHAIKIAVDKPVRNPVREQFMLGIEPGRFERVRPEVASWVVMVVCFCQGVVKLLEKRLSKSRGNNP